MTSIPWISRNPAADIQNLSYQTPMSEANFEEICRRIIHEADHERKLEILYQSRGYFSAEQSGHLLSAISRPKDKVKAVMIMEPRLIPMTCQQARSILASISIANDKLEALQYIKRALNDAGSQEGVDNIINTFTFYEDKIKAAAILETVATRHGLRIAAGGHQGYAPLGGLYTSAQPNNPHIYGSSADQVEHLPNHGTGKFKIAEAFERKLPSIYTESKSYAHPISKTSYQNIRLV